MNINRRHALERSVALLASAWGAPAFAIDAKSQLDTALKKSPLIYLSPLVSNGRESRCHAEVWFIYREDEIYVVTWAEKWKAEAMRRGFSRARIWVGDFGPWRSANERYKAAPSLEIEGRFETDAAIHEQLLTDFANKYNAEWRVWDKRVRDGLANGGWVLLRYQIPL